MQDYFFGTMDEYIETSYAPTSRASCRNCHNKILKGQVRLGEIMEDDHFNSKHYYHLACFKLKPLFRNIDPKRQIYKMEELDKDDQGAVIDHVQREVERLEGGGKGKKGSAKKAKSKPKKEKEEEDDEQFQEKPPKRLTRSTSKPNAKSRPKSKRQKQRSPSPSPSPPKKVRAKKASSKSTKGSAKKLKKAATEQAYSEQQKEKMQELREKYSNLSVAKLKEFLVANNQTQTGSKGDLVEKCADGELLGRIPLCSLCGGGKLRFMWRCSLYQCPGYMDDDEFKNCNRYFTMADVKREPWVQPP